MDTLWVFEDAHLKPFASAACALLKINSGNEWTFHKLDLTPANIKQRALLQGCLRQTDLCYNDLFQIDRGGQQGAAPPFDPNGRYVRFDTKNRTTLKCNPH